MSGKTISNILGWYGAIALLLGFGLISFHFLDANNPWYQLLNLTGGAGIVIVSLSRKAYPPAFLNTIWSVIALIALIRLFFLT